MRATLARYKAKLEPQLRARGRHAWIVLQESLGAFARNDGFRQASSLAYATTLALIPVLLLLSYALTLGIGSSQAALEKTHAFVSSIIPQFGDVLLREVQTLAQHKRSAGMVNALVLLWAMTPLVSGLRAAFNRIFKVEAQKPFWLSKLMDLGVACLFIIGITLVAGLDAFFGFLHPKIPLKLPWILRHALPFAATMALLLGLYRVFAPKLRWRDLLSGALATTALWFLLKPTFTLFLTFDPNYGVTFGSFKALFIIIIWIYYSMVVLMFGAEFMAALSREETLIIRRMIKGKRNLSKLGKHKFVITLPSGSVIFKEGDTGGTMYHLLKGEVGIYKKQHEIANLKIGAFFGEMSYLLGEPRSATAIAKDDCELLIIQENNLTSLMREYPDTIRDMLHEMARRLRETSNR